MARIAGVDLPREKRVEIGLTYIFGIGRSSSNRILTEAKINPDTRVRDLTDDEVSRIREYKAFNRNRLLSWCPPQKRPACSRPVFKAKRTHT